MQPSRMTKKILEHYFFLLNNPKTYLRPCQTLNNILRKLVTQPLIIFAKLFIVDVFQGPRNCYANESEINDSDVNEMILQKTESTLFLCGSRRKSRTVDLLLIFQHYLQLCRKSSNKFHSLNIMKKIMTLNKTVHRSLFRKDNFKGNICTAQKVKFSIADFFTEEICNKKLHFFVQC